MKTILFALCIFCTLLIFSCKKTTENPANNFFIGADFQNVTWLAQPATSYFANRDSLKVQGLHTPGNQYLVFNMKFTGLGTDTLTTAGQGSYYTTDINGAATSNYKLDVTKTNTITITSFNVGTEVVTGTFQLNFVKTSGGSAFSSTANFTNGKFWFALPAVD